MLMVMDAKINICISNDGWYDTAYPLQQLHPLMVVAYRL